MGAGYNGHVFFTHSYPEGDFFHKVTGRWTLNPTNLPAANKAGARYNVWIHLPNYTAWAAALGVNDRWAQAMTDSRVAPTATRSARRAQRMSLFGPAIAVALVTSAAASVASPSSGGGSGGGGVGGGEGGGGGGSW
ncbi:hypothetical protein ACNPQM_22015 [Streptomyces sp. NPDC056231]|uniref:hypothetical protein n=1 Tax=Streptomyces sp. NPDC056231 TaxID=3345755 RepID=UPI003AABE911